MMIQPLRDCPEWIETVTDWMQEEFGAADSRHFYQEIVTHSLTENRLPITFVAVEDGMLVGTVGIWRGDLLSRQDVSPWLSALIVHPDHRKAGIGKALQRHVLEYCKARSIPEIYLYTELEGYYEKTGWLRTDIGYEYTGNPVQLYRHSL